MNAFDCNVPASFTSNAAQEQRVGFITDLTGLGLPHPLIKDITVTAPFDTLAAYPPLALTEGRANVVAVIQSVSWSGGVSDPINFSGYISTENATRIRQFTISEIASLGFCVVNFDLEAKVWFGEFYPQAPVRIACELNKTANNQLALNVADTPTLISSGVSLWSVQLQLLPSATQGANLAVASGIGRQLVSSWGLATVLPGPSSTPTSPTPTPLPSTGGEVPASPPILITPASPLGILEEAASGLAADLPGGLGNPF